VVTLFKGKSVAGMGFKSRIPALHPLRISTKNPVQSFLQQKVITLETLTSLSYHSRRTSTKRGQAFPFGEMPHSGNGGYPHHTKSLLTARPKNIFLLFKAYSVLRPPAQCFSSTLPQNLGCLAVDTCHPVHACPYLHWHTERDLKQYISVESC